MKTSMKQTVATAVVLHMVALVYLYVMDLRVVQPGYVDWNSEMGHILMVPVAFSIVYAWTMILCIPLMSEHDAQVLENDGDWKAKAQHFSDKHSQVSTYFN